MAIEVSNEPVVFTVDKIDPILLYGVGDAHLKLIEKSFPVELVARGNQIKIIGDPENVRMVEDILSELVFIANRNNNLELRDVETVISIARANTTISQETVSRKPTHTASDLEEVILFTQRGFIKPRTAGQQRIVQSTRENDIVVVIGPAGTGKTYLAVALAVNALKNKDVDKIVLARPAVEAGESLGFLPGDYKEKIDPYLRPLYDALDEMLPRELLRKYMEQRIIEVIPLAYMRGRTLNNAFVILDEAQNATSMQMKMCLTRLGVNSRAIINGDITQVDLPVSSTSGLIEIQQVLSGIEGIEFIYLDRSDVVRHRLVRDIIYAYDKRNDEKSE
ncbi:MAG: PhoH family protein [Calditrichaeota bacterium]|nr:PhoH family protein [Calditrichota bacterium]RQW07618.1 MAG: PhoH family protein [Calditrichota bacterium]